MLIIVGFAAASTSRVLGQAKRFTHEIADGVKRSADIMKQIALDGLRREIDEMLPLVRQVMPQHPGHR